MSQASRRSFLAVAGSGAVTTAVVAAAPSSRAASESSSSSSTTGTQPLVTPATPAHQCLSRARAPGDLARPL